MDKSSQNKEQSTTASLVELLKKYTTRIEEQKIAKQESSVPPPPLKKVQNDEILKPKETVNNLQAKANSDVDFDQSTINLNEERSNIDYKEKLEEAEAKYYALEKKYHQLENGTVKQLQAKIDQLQQESNQMKLIKERIAEICSCRQLTNTQLEQLKQLVNCNNDLSIETIANKNDFHQQTIKLRDVLITHNNELLNKIEELIKKKRKRDQYENDLTDDNNIMD